MQNIPVNQPVAVAQKTVSELLYQVVQKTRIARTTAVACEQIERLQNIHLLFVTHQDGKNEPIYGCAIDLLKPVHNFVQLRRTTLSAKHKQTREQVVFSNHLARNVYPKAHLTKYMPLIGDLITPIMDKMTVVLLLIKLIRDEPSVQFYTEQNGTLYAEQINQWFKNTYHVHQNTSFHVESLSLTQIINEAIVERTSDNLWT